MNDIGAIVLAAGGSRRLGTPKQTLPYAGSSLLQRTVDIVASAGISLVTVVTGANGESISIAGDGVRLIHNPDWASGLSSSIRTGITAMCHVSPPVSGCLLLVCDQPFMTAQLLRELIDKHYQSGKGIVASAYANTLGTPVLFDERYFSELLKLSGDEGAKKLIRRYTDDVATVPFPLGEIDIDTIEDYERLIAHATDGLR